MQLVLHAKAYASRMHVINIVPYSCAAKTVNNSHSSLRHILLIKFNNFEHKKLVIKNLNWIIIKS